MKKLVSLVLALALILSMMILPAQAEGSKLIGVCMQNMSSSISVLEADALKATFEPLGYTVQIASADDNVSTQMQQVNTFVLQGAEMLIILPCQIETLEDSLIDARERDGVKVVVSGGTGTISEDAYDAVVSDDEFMIGMYVASVAKTWIHDRYVCSFRCQDLDRAEHGSERRLGCGIHLLHHLCRRQGSLRR